jgi:hypothetical protein
MKFKSNAQRRAVMIKLQRVNYGSPNTPIKLREYKIKNDVNSPVGTKSEWKAYLDKQKMLEPFQKDKWTESDVKQALKLLRHNKIKASELFTEKQNYNLYHGNGVRLTSEQTNKGLHFLNKKTFAKNGSIKNSSALQEREAEILSTAREIKLQDFHSERMNGDYVPVYKVVSNLGDSFDYYYRLGKIHVIG